MPVQHEFGGPWTQEKLEKVRKYLVAYTTIFHGNPRARYYRTVYVDAFAGCGHRSDPRRDDIPDSLFTDLADPERVGLLKGSARIALEVEPSFDQYVFVERSSERIRDLEVLRQDFPDKASKVTIIQEDANSYLQEWCGETDWKRWRAVVFLDPYGLQVEWPTIEAIAATRSIDLWYLFPLGVGVNRLLTRDAPPPKKWAEALTRLLGTSDWQEAFYRNDKQLTLFGEANPQQKEADFGSIGRFFVKRLETVFAGVADNPLALYNSKGVPLYLLCFAVGNEDKVKTAIRIAQDILRG